MATKLKNPAAAQPLTHKEIRSQIERKLESALIDWKATLGEKKFKRRIRKAGKLFGKKLSVEHKKSSVTGKKKHGKKAIAVMLEQEVAAK